jgi:hypothetical protein
MMHGRSDDGLASRFIPGGVGIAISLAALSPLCWIRSCVSMRFPSVKPPHEVNVIIEVSVGGEPIKYEMDNRRVTL